MTNVPFGTRPATTGVRVLRISLMIIAIAAAALATWYFTRRPSESAVPAMDMSGAPAAARSVTMSDADQQRIGVTFATAEVRPLEREVRTVAQVVYDETRIAVFSLKVDGWVDRLQVNTTGEVVHRGDTLLALYSPMLVTAQQELLLARRLTTDVAGGTAGTQSGADALYAAASRRLQQWDVPQSEIDAVVRDGSAHHDVTFLSPVAGVVIEKNVLLGQRVMAGEALFRIADLSQVWLDGEVFGQDLAMVRVGQEVTADFASLPGTTRQGRISFIYPTLDVDTRTAHIRVELSNPGLVLKPGMYATLRFVSTRAGVLSVPRSSVLTTGERSIVFVRDTDNRFVAREVALGESTDERIEIRQGIKAGEVVVASGTFLVDAESNLDKALGGMGNMPGMDVKPAPPPAKGAKVPGGMP